MGEILLGTMVKRVTSALGIPSCLNCEKRKEIMDNWSRRGFIGGLAAVGVAAKMKFWQTVVKPDSSHALTLARTLNSVQNALYFEHNQTRYGTKEEAWAVLYDGMRRHNQENTPSGAFWRSLNLESEEITPGWLLDYASTPAGYTFIILAKDKSEIYISDQIGVIYRAPVPEKDIPKARSLPAAKDFPGAVVHDQFIAERQSTVLSRFLSALGIPVAVYAQTGACAECCTGCSEGNCDTKPHCAAFDCGGLPCTWCYYSFSNMKSKDCVIACQCACECMAGTAACCQPYC
jgi:hypothetical protein